MVAGEFIRLPVLPTNVRNPENMCSF